MYDNKQLDREKIYKPCRTIYYNSGRYTFFETHLDKNTILLGNNNAGKTSFLNGLQFFLLPEINLKRLHDKFHFNKKYTTKETYEYYFPTNNSFIIAEFENAFGKFVQILFRNSDDYSYSRVFTKTSYEEIREQLWDSENNSIRKTQGIDFKNYLKGTLNYKYAADKDTINKLIYSNNINSEDEGRYAIIPINNGGAKSTNIKQLVKLAFNIDVITGDDLKDVFISFIEGGLKNLKDTVDIDFHKLCEQQDQYKKELHHYAIVNNQKEDFIRVKSNVKIIQEIGPIIYKEYTDICNFHSRYFRKTNDLMAVINEACISLESARDASRLIWTDAKNNHTSIENNIVVEKNRKKEQEDKYKHFKNIVEKYNLQEKSQIEQLMFFETEIKRIKDDLTIVENKEEISKAIALLNREIASLKKENLEIESILKENSDPKIVYNQLNDKDRQLLRTIWPKESGSEYILTDREKDIISSLHELISFNSSNNYYMIFNEKLKRVVDDLDLKSQEEKLIKNNEKLKTLNEDLISKIALQDGEITKNKNKLNEDLIVFKRDMDIISKYFSYDSEILITEEKIKSLEIEEKTAALLKSTTAERANQDSNTYVQKKTEQDQLNKELEEHKSLYDKIEINASRLGLQPVEPNLEITVVTNKLTKEMVDIFCSELESTDKAKKDLHKDLQMFVAKSIISDDDQELVYSGITTKTMMSFVDKLVYIYENIDEKINSIKQSMYNGFSDAYDSAEKFDEYKKHISSSIGAFNQKIERTSVSNFDHISIKIDFDMRFDDFNKTYRDIDHHNPTDISIDTFFLKLRQFLDKSGIKEKITLHKIINNFTVQYHTKSGIETKAQSNGTGIMANAVILSQLKNELIGNGSNVIKLKYFLPIIVDEVSNIDNHNLKTLKKFLSEKDFIMFCATPTPTISIDNNYEIVIQLSSNVRHEIFDPQRPVVHFLPENLFIRKIESQEDSFGDVLEA